MFAEMQPSVCQPGRSRRNESPSGLRNCHPVKHHPSLPFMVPKGCSACFITPSELTLNTSWCWKELGWCWARVCWAHLCVVWGLLSIISTCLLQISPRNTNRMLSRWAEPTEIFWFSPQKMGDERHENCLRETTWFVLFWLLQ